MGLIDDARARADARPEPRRIDYDRMRRTWPKYKAALTRAKKTGDPEKVAAACVAAMNEWDEIGAWPDDWSLFQRALDDVLPWNQRIDLNDLPR
jgi:hypothetical protein